MAGIKAVRLMRNPCANVIRARAIAQQQAGYIAAIRFSIQKTIFLAKRGSPYITVGFL